MTHSETNDRRPAFNLSSSARFRQAVLTLMAVLLLQASAVAATFAVTNANDGGAGSLRQAIADANSNPGFDLINFNIPSADPNCNATTGVCTIRPVDYLWLESPMEIDGYTQPGASANTLAQGTNAVLKIEIKGWRGVPNPPSTWWGIRTGGTGTTIKGLIINNFHGYGVEMGGNARVLGCFIGTDATGTAAIPNGRSLSNGEGEGGIVVSGNLNRIGVADVSAGAVPADRNLISGNAGHGIVFPNNGGSGAPTDGNQIWNNLIGTKADGASPLGNGNDGIFMRNWTSGPIHDNHIANNVIAFNGGIGVNIAHGGVGTSNPPMRNRILANSIYANGNLGINLAQSVGGVDLNDACDGDAGGFSPNDSQNYPVITSAVTSGGNYLVDGFLNSNAGGTYTLQFFASDSCDASGHGEGKTFLGETTITDADNDCKSPFSASFPVPAGAGLIITATATDSAGNTSEFSSCAPAGAGCLPTDALVSRYHGENSAYDSQDRNHGTPQDGVFPGGMNFGDGLLGRAFRLDGANDFVRIRHGGSLNFTQFTLEAWVKTDQPAGTNGIIWSKNATYLGYNDPFTLMIVPDGRAAGRVGKGDNATEVDVSSSAAVNDNNWHHLALTFDGVSLKLYRDGNLEDSRPVPFPLFNNTQDVIVGQWAAHAPTPLHNYRGLIDELSVHSRALSASEIAAIYMGGTTGQCQPTDSDGDGVGNATDNCPAVANPDQADADGDGAGDACDPNPNDGPLGDLDGDGVRNNADNCPTTANPDQADADQDGMGDACDSAPGCPGIAAPADLISLWKAESNALDSRSNNHGTPQNGATFAAGEVGQAFRFPNSSSQVTVPDNPSFNQQTLTLEGWVTAQAYTCAGCGQFIASKSGSNQSFGYEFGTQRENSGTDSGALRFTLNGGAGGADLLDDVSIAGGNFHHVAATYDGATMKIYLDGALAAQKAVVLTINYEDNSPFVIGFRQNSGSTNNYNGLVDELSFYGRALTQEEIQNIYLAGSVGKCGALDIDNDGIGDGADDCPNTPNTDQLDTDSDGQGDACDADDDGDGFSDTDETAANSDPLNPNSTPEVCDGLDNDLNDGTDEGFTNTDGDAQADCVDEDDDGDGFADEVETTAGSNPLDANSTPEVCDGLDNDLNDGVDEGFTNTDGDGQADCVDADDDNDGQTDADESACGSDPLDAGSRAADTDGDERPNCVDPDDDGDGVPDASDNCALNANAGQEDADGDGQGNVCDLDDDNDGVLDLDDNCPLAFNPTQADADHDGAGDPCDPDDDNDGVADASDNCPLVANPDQADADHNGVGDVCDAAHQGPPRNKEQCKNDGWMRFDVPRKFKNQGDCIQYVNTGK